MVLPQVADEDTTAREAMVLIASFGTLICFNHGTNGNVTLISP